MVMSEQFYNELLTERLYQLNLKLVGYNDSDWSGDIDDRKSTSGFVFYMGDITFIWV